MRPSTLRRLAILAEGEFGPHNAKTAYGVIRYGRDDVAAVINSTRAGQNVDAYLPGHDIPIVATLADALAIEPPPDALLIGIAPTGGRLPQSWRTVILDAIAAGLDVLSGLHTFIGDDPEFAAAAAAAGSTIVDYRRPPERMETAVGRRHAPGKRVILTVGSDCAIGKMSVALELRRAAQTSGDSVAFVATGQTGMMIEGWGVAVDRLISDFAQGTVEWLVGRGRGARRLGHRRGPGLARPPGLLVRDPGADPWLDAAGDGHGPRPGSRASTISTTSRRRRSRSPSCPGSSRCTSGWRTSWRRRRSSRSRSTRRATRTKTRRAG